MALVLSCPAHPRSRLSHPWKKCAAASSSMTIRSVMRPWVWFRSTQNKIMNVVLGVGGGIAAYKAAELARRLQEHGCAVEVVMTASAQQFIQPLTFAALTGHKVIT